MHRAHRDYGDTVMSTLAHTAEFTRTALHDATTALLTPNIHLAQAVISRHTEADALLDGLDEWALKLTARPSKTDLAALASAIRISADIEHMANLAVGIAKVARLRYQEPVIPAELCDALHVRCRAAADCAGRLARSLGSQNPYIGPTIRNDYNTLDHAHRDLLTTLTAPITPYPITTSIDAILVAGYYKHFADHATAATHRAISVLNQWADTSDVTSRCDPVPSTGTSRSSAAARRGHSASLTRLDPATCG